MGTNDPNAIGREAAVELTKVQLDLTSRTATVVIRGLADQRYRGTEIRVDFYYELVDGEGAKKTEQRIVGEALQILKEASDDTDLVR